MPEEECSLLASTHSVVSIAARLKPFPAPPRKRLLLRQGTSCVHCCRKRVVSGVQPTGSVHLGNYLGAIKNWVALQDSYETFFFIVDLHAITLPYEAPLLSKATRSTAAIYLACGVDSSKASIFVQSHVHAHVELMWLLSSSTPIGWLNRMIQFKEKSRKAVRHLLAMKMLGLHF